MKTFNKISNTEIEIVETVPVVKRLALDDLLAQRDSFVRTIEANNEENLQRNAQIVLLIEEIDAQVSEARKLNIQTRAEYDIANPAPIEMPPVFEEATTTPKT